jgi:hypothetical protein
MTCRRPPNPGRPRCCWPTRAASKRSGMERARATSSVAAALASADERNGRTSCGGGRPTTSSGSPIRPPAPSSSPPSGTPSQTASPPGPSASSTGPSPSPNRSPTTGDGRSPPTASRTGCAGAGRSRRRASRCAWRRRLPATACSHEPRRRWRRSMPAPRPTPWRPSAVRERGPGRRPRSRPPARTPGRDRHVCCCARPSPRRDRCPGPSAIRCCRRSSRRSPAATPSRRRR